jgi:hypothetical protein
MQLILSNQRVTELTRDKINNFVTIRSLQYGTIGYFVNLGRYKFL